MTYILKVFAAALMVVSAVLGVIAFSDTVDNLGRAGGERMFGALMLAAFACFVIAFLSGGILWVLTDISQRLAGPAKEADTLAAIKQNLKQELEARS